MEKPIASLLSFESLVDAISRVDTDLAAQASRAVNTSLTLRNYLIGCYIYEYQQKGADRAQYGDLLLDQLSKRLMSAGISRAEIRELRRYRQFYLTYPQIRESLTPELTAMLIPQGKPHKNEVLVPSEIGIPATDILTKLSFTHIAELLQCDDPAKRAFYEKECICGNWSVRELRRQIASLYYERLGLSKDKASLAAMTGASVESNKLTLDIRDPYVFEFLGLKAQEVMSESSLEAQLLDKLQDFLLELGNGFCFEARQKRILIGDGLYFVDLVFYHRILKCHVLVELKVAAFSHENIGQLNTYVNWYRKNMMTAGDNPPVGILLCTQKDHALVEYALAGIDNGLFVSKYQLELPRKEDMQLFIEKHLVSLD